MSNQAKQSKPKRVATYTRMSEIHPNFSQGQQMTEIRKYAKRRGLKIVMNYSDVAKGGGKP
jgi:DNA invertase Pin-like site-specific DNA recombinase